MPDVSATIKRILNHYWLNVGLTIVLQIENCKIDAYSCDALLFNLLLTCLICFICLIIVFRMATNTCSPKWRQLWLLWSFNLYAITSALINKIEKCFTSMFTHFLLIWIAIEIHNKSLYYCQTIFSKSICMQCNRTLSWIYSVYISSLNERQINDMLTHIID
jgi:hypothetical protein